jgi:HK97 family phage major capsid protein
MNAVLERLLEQRGEQIGSMDAILAQVDGRDLVDAERSLLEAARQRIAELDAQIGPLEAFEELSASHRDTLAALPRRERAEGRLDANQPAPVYGSAGAFVVDLIRARGFMERNDGSPDSAALARVQQSRAVANQTTANTPGILPTPIIGPVVNLIDANRPLISSLGGARALGGIPGKTFSRPKITTHTTVGPQSAEKTQLPSQAMQIDGIPFTKSTYGGTVDISRQDIDWTSPAAWDILINDLGNVYAIQTETAVATAFAGAATGGPITVEADTLQGWANALYDAAAASYTDSKRMPNRIWCSVDVWAMLGALVDIGRLVMPPSQTEQPAGDTTLADFSGNVIGLPRIVVPTFPAGTCIVGPASLYEVYEEVIGLLSVVEPSILGVTVAYGGYVAWGTLEGGAFVKLTAPAPAIEAASTKSK